MAIHLPEGTQLTADQDPETVRQVGDRERARFEQLIADLADDDEILKAGSAALEAYEEALDRADTAVSAAETARSFYFVARNTRTSHPQARSRLMMS